MIIQLMVIIASDEPIDEKGLIDKLSETAKNFCSENAAVVIGPANIETEDDFNSINVGR